MYVCMCIYIYLYIYVSISLSLSPSLVCVSLYLSLSLSLYLCVCVCIYLSLLSLYLPISLPCKKILAPLINMIKAAVKIISIVNPFDLLIKKSTLSVDNKNLKGGEYHYEINVFL